MAGNPKEAKKPKMVEAEGKVNIIVDKSWVIQKGVKVKLPEEVYKYAKKKGYVK